MGDDCSRWVLGDNGSGGAAGYCDGWSRVLERGLRTMMTEDRKPLRDTFRGIQKGARVHIRGTKVRSSMNATVTALLEPNAIRCRSDRNGGEYTVLLSDCRRLSKAPREQR